jgi:NACalpha-BTF3-like transcription factor
MEITLEKIELVKDRTGVSYKEAKEALESANGSVVDAIIAIEETIDEKTKGKFSEHGANIIASIKDAVKKGNVSKIIVKKDDDVVLNLPLNVGIIGTVLAPWAMIAGVITAFGTKCVIELVKEDGTTYDISEMANDTFGDIVEKGSVIADEMKVKGNDVYNSVKDKASEAMSKVKKDDEDLDFDFDDNDNDVK